MATDLSNTECHLCGQPIPPKVHWRHFVEVGNQRYARVCVHLYPCLAARAENPPAPAQVEPEPDPTPALPQLPSPQGQLF